MQAPEVVQHVVRDLERLQVPYFISGSIASMYYGEARLTRDADIVVDLTYESAAKLCESLAVTDFYVSPEAARDAVGMSGQFNVIDGGRNFKVDLMQIHDTGYDSLRMDRRRREFPFVGFEAWISAPEDVILRKLLSYKDGESDKHLRDTASMLKISGDQIDRQYTEHWAMRLGVSDLWRYVLARAEGREPGPMA